MINEKIFTYPSSDGENTIAARWWVDEERKPKAILQIIHGMVEHTGRYDEFARYMAGQGYLVCANDHLGHGDSVKSMEDLGYINTKGSSDYLIQDIHRLREIVQKAFPDTKYIMLGHSMGSYLLRKYLVSRSEGLVGAIVMGTGYQPAVLADFGLLLCNVIAKFKGWKYRCEFIRKMTWGASYKNFDKTGQDPARSWLTRDVAIVEAFNQDPKCGFLFTLAGYKALFEAVSFSCSIKNAAKIRKDLPVLFISGSDDPVGAKGTGVRIVYDMYKKLGIDNVYIKLYPEARHELTNEINRQEVFNDICNWADNTLIQSNRWRRWTARPEDAANVEGEASK